MLGWGPYQNDHEDANGQFEMNWDFSDCLQTADRHVFFKSIPAFLQTIKPSPKAARWVEAK